MGDRHRPVRWCRTARHIARQSSDPSISGVSRRNPGSLVGSRTLPALSNDLHDLFFVSLSHLKHSITEIKILPYRYSKNLRGRVCFLRANLLSPARAHFTFCQIENSDSVTGSYAFCDGAANGKFNV